MNRFNYNPASMKLEVFGHSLLQGGHCPPPIRGSAGGFGREVFYLLDDHFYECIGFIDFDKTEEDLKLIIEKFKSKSSK